MRILAVNVQAGLTRFGAVGTGRYLAITLQIFVSKIAPQQLCHVQLVGIGIVGRAIGARFKLTLIRRVRHLRQARRTFFGAGRVAMASSWGLDGCRR